MPSPADSDVSGGSVTVDEAPLLCARHPQTETALRCGKCLAPICTRCIVQTSVGARCKDCAGIGRKSPMALGPALLLRALGAGLAAGTLGWLLVDGVGSFRFFLAVFVGVAVGTAMTVGAKRRISPALDVAAVAAVLGGFVLAAVLLRLTGAVHSERGQLSLFGTVIPLVLASFVAVVRVR